MMGTEHAKAGMALANWVLDSIVAQLPHTGMGLTGTQYVGEGLCLVAAASEPLASVPVPDGTVEQQAVDVGALDEAPI